MKIDIPNYDSLELDKIVFDFNGTIAEDGKLLDGVEKAINNLADNFEVNIITADTFGTVSEIIDKINAELVLDKADEGALFKKNYIESIGSSNVIAVGNGNNDAEMLKNAALGIALIGSEGAAGDALRNADLIIRDIKDLFDILNNENKLRATLRR